ncbi:hypothetical protein D3C86_2121370 [compost metagenome]
MINPSVIISSILKVVCVVFSTGILSEVIVKILSVLAPFTTSIETAPLNFDTFAASNISYPIVGLLNISPTPGPSTIVPVT